MARPIWQGTIGFGLVEIPVGLYAAEKPRELDLTMLDRRDFSPVGYSRYNKVTNEDVPWAEIVRGYEYEKGQYVVLSDADLKRANPELTKTIHILRFVDPKEIEPIYFERPYYLAPMRKRSKGYVLLRETLLRTKTVGVARMAIRTREHIAMVGVRDDLLALYLLRYPTEIREPEGIDGAELDLESVGVTSKEVQMAVKIVEGMTEPWDPSDYEDQYTEDVMALVEKKIKSGAVHEITEPGREEPEADRGMVLDLMPLLKQSPRADQAKRKRRSVEESEEEGSDAQDGEAAGAEEDRLSACDGIA